MSVSHIEVEGAVARAKRLVGVALELLLEDELALWEEDKRELIYGGPWLTDDAGRPHQRIATLRERVPALLEGVLRAFCDHGAVPEIAHVQALGAMTIVEGVVADRTNLFRAWRPRAALLPPLVAALLSAEGRLPPLGAWGFSSHVGLAGDDADAYGTHKEPGYHACERLLTLDVVGGDARAAVGMLPLVTGTRDQYDSPACTPERRARADLELAEFGITPPSAPGDHLGPLLELVRAVTDVLDRVRDRGSRTLGLAKLSVSGLRRDGVPVVAVIGPIRYGPLRGGADSRAPLYWPGTDASLIAEAQRQRVPVLALAFGSAALDGGDVPGLERIMLQQPVVTGRDLADVLSSPTRLVEVQALKQPFSSELRPLSGHPSAKRLGVSFDADRETVLTAPKPNLLLLARGRQPLPVALLLHSALSDEDGTTPSGTLAWTSNFDVTRDEHRDEVVIIAQLHRRAMELTPPLGRCTSRAFRAFPLHQLKPGMFKTRTYLRIVAMLANLVVVGEGRATQSASD